MNTTEAMPTDWVQIIRGEFQEIPGLHLTKAEFQRMWSLDLATCDALLGELVDRHFLKRIHDGTYARADSGC
jgi:hypothetical protein